MEALEKELRYAELNLVKRTYTRAGTQDHIVLKEISDTQTELTEGRLGIRVGRNKARTFVKNASFDDLLKLYVGKGYVQVPGKKAPAEKKEVKQVSTTDFEPEENPIAEKLVSFLRACEQQTIEAQFSTLTIEALSDEQEAKGKEVLKTLCDNYKGMSKKEFNDLLCYYYSVIPRRITNIQDATVSGKDHYGLILTPEAFEDQKAVLLSKEQEYLDLLLNYLEDKEVAKGKMATEQYGLIIDKPSEKQMDWLKYKLKKANLQLEDAYAVQNIATKKAFDQFCVKNNLTIENDGITPLFHGSGHHNWWSIFKTGLKINPEAVMPGVQICGKAYGYGTYFAPYAGKSMGYTDFIGSRWRHGGDCIGILGVFNVATGKPDQRYDAPVDTTLNWSNLQRKAPGSICTWAKSRTSGFCYDEIIIYQDCQSTIDMIVTVKS